MGLFFGARRAEPALPPGLAAGAALGATSVSPGGAASGPASAAADMRSVLLTLDGWLIGELCNPARRLTDGLAASTTLTLVAGDGPREIDRDEVLMVVPPPLDPSPELQIAKRRVPVAVEIGEITVHGHCHVLPGATVWDVWQRSSSGFAPLTEAVIVFPDGTSETADVILVSRHAASIGLTAG